ncbi:fatty acid desaturase [Ramlibacter sp.]|uniref:fatty acid desaturase n=1 Tax=Ramlibacter sp. TaxID=1917967 RepID=UPI003D11207B
MIAAISHFDEGEVVYMDAAIYARRVAYFLLTTFIVVLGSAVAVRELLLSPWDALYVLPVAFIATALGANTGFHMYFTHRSFKTNAVARGGLALLGTLLCQDGLIQWVANHKRHHRHVDVADRDPHSPRQFGADPWRVLTVGLWWASMGWKFSRILTDKRFYAGQMLDDALLSWFDRRFVLISYAGFVVPFGLGWAIGGEDLAVKWFAYFGAFRVFVGYFFTEFVVNGLCHCVGSSKFVTKGNSTNLVLMSPLTMGATLHHNHHAFPRVLSPAFDGEPDPMRVVYRWLERWGLLVMNPDPSFVEIEAKRMQRPLSGEPSLAHLTTSNFTVVFATQGARFGGHRVRQRVEGVGLLSIRGNPDRTIWCAVRPCYLVRASNPRDGAGGELVLDVWVENQSRMRNAFEMPMQSMAERWVVDPVIGRVTRLPR